MIIVFVINVFEVFSSKKEVDNRFNLMQTLKYSRQREYIKSYLMSRKDHPTADMVYMDVRREYPHISLGTVYRNLSLLTELGEIQKITGGDSDRYDGNIHPHYHFCCRRCQRVIDIDIQVDNSIEDEARKTFAGTIEAHSVMFHGICEECSAMPQTN